MCHILVINYRKCGLKFTLQQGNVKLLLIFKKKLDECTFYTYICTIII